MFVPIILGSDKTTMSIATGQSEFYPLYLSIGNVCNNVRRAHRNALVLLGFLAIPKGKYFFLNPSSGIGVEQYDPGARSDDRSPLFCRFRRQLYHQSLSAILQPLKPYMTTPDVARCPDQHFRRVIYGLGPYIADYPEQVLLAAVVSGWCVRYIFQNLITNNTNYMCRCAAPAGDLDQPNSLLCSQEHTEACLEAFDNQDVWDSYGIIADIIVHPSYY